MHAAPTGHDREPSEAGFTVATAIWIMAVTLLLVTTFANLLVQRYAQAVIRQATDEAARAWAVNGGTETDCKAAAVDVLDDLLGGSLASGVVVTCSQSERTVTATATATLAGLPPLPDTHFSTASVVTKELQDDLRAP